MGRVVKAGEPVWLPSDVDLALEWQAERDGRHTCGHPLDESTHPDNEDEYDTRIVRCFACAERDRAMAQFDGDKAGLMFAVERRRGEQPE